jgi:hypothetical protein
MDILGAGRPLRESSIVRQFIRIENKLRNLKLCSMQVPALKFGAIPFVAKSKIGKRCGVTVPSHRLIHWLATVACDWLPPE